MLQLTREGWGNQEGTNHHPPKGATNTAAHTTNPRRPNCMADSTAQAGFPVTADAQEVQTDRDKLLGNPVARFLHPAISTFIQERWQALDSSERTPSRAEVLAKRLEETWRWSQPSARPPEDTHSATSPKDEVMCEPDPKPLMANHRIE